MKNIKYILFVITAFVFILPLNSNAQQSNEVFVSYNFGIPLADSKEYVSRVSFIGSEINYKRYLNPNISASLSFAWNVFYQETSDLISLPNADVSGKQNRYLNVLPVLVGMQYYIGDSKSRLYVGGNMGALYSTRKLQLGVNEYLDNQWRFMIQPEIGYVFNIDRNSDVALGVTYNHCFATFANIFGKDISESWVGLKLSYGWKR